MSDMGDDFRAMNQQQKEKRADNRQSSTQVLAKAGVVFEAKNMGAHLIVQDSGETIDFWPGTGLWIVRNNGLRGRGVKSMLDWLFEEPQDNPFEVL